MKCQYFFPHVHWIWPWGFKCQHICISDNADPKDMNDPEKRGTGICQKTHSWGGAGLGSPPSPHVLLISASSLDCQAICLHEVGQGTIMEGVSKNQNLGPRPLLSTISPVCRTHCMNLVNSLPSLSLKLTPFSFLPALIFQWSKNHSNFSILTDLTLKIERKCIFLILAYLKCSLIAPTLFCFSVSPLF